ncbi:uncharacterized protein F54H12.2-like [Haliotis cracherodii]|uniref:uncharacterized protein F54H12.2-like n=1 Tax=Haliotis cracherodii TaxID=6455 RepID=UPI0039E7FCDE
MSGPLYEDIFHINRHLVNVVDLTVKLYRSSPQFCLMSGKTGQDYKVEILDTYLKVCKLKVNPALILAYNILFQDSNALYPYTKSEVKVTSIPTTQLTHTIDNLSNPIANRYIVGFVLSNSLNGSYTGNPYNFQSSMVKNISLYINGASVPGRPMQADDVESYVQMFDGLCLWKENTGNGITRSDFLLGSALFVFDIDKGYVLQRKLFDSLDYLHHEQTYGSPEQEHIPTPDRQPGKGEDSDSGTTTTTTDNDSDSGLGDESSETE